VPFAPLQNAVSLYLGIFFKRKIQAAAQGVKQYAAIL